MTLHQSHCLHLTQISELTECRLIKLGCKQKTLKQSTLDGTSLKAPHNNREHVHQRCVRSSCSAASIPSTRRTAVSSQLKPAAPACPPGVRGFVSATGWPEVSDAPGIAGPDIALSVANVAKGGYVLSSAVQLI
eukprot:463696-Pelagomonas_calceolata.AAC.4